VTTSEPAAASSSSPIVFTTTIADPPRTVWAELTDNEVPRAWMWDTTVLSSWEPGHPYVMSSHGTALVIGEVLAVDWPHLLRLTFDARWDDESSAEEAGELEYVLEEVDASSTRLTVTITGGGPATHGSAASDTPGIYTNLKSWMETGKVDAH